MFQAHVFQTGSDCVAFLVNSNLHGKVDVQFHNNKFELPARSIIILSRCNKTVFNTAEVNIIPDSHLSFYWSFNYYLN